MPRQDINLAGSGTTLGILAAATWGPVTATGYIVYTDGTVQPFTFTVPDWQNDTVPAGDQIAVTAPYQNRPGGVQYDHPAYVWSTTVTLDSAVAYIQLPAVSTGVQNGQPALHVFDLVIAG